MPRVSGNNIDVDDDNRYAMPRVSNEIDDVGNAIGGVRDAKHFVSKGVSNIKSSNLFGVQPQNTSNTRYIVYF